MKRLLVIILALFALAGCKKEDHYLYHYTITNNLDITMNDITIYSYTGTILKDMYNIPDIKSNGVSGSIGSNFERIKVSYRKFPKQVIESNDRLFIDCFTIISGKANCIVINKNTITDTVFNNH